MQTKVAVFGLLAIATSVFAQDAATSTKTHKPHGTPAWLASIEPAKLSAYQADVKALEASIHANPLYPSLTSILATATPTVTGKRAKNKHVAEDHPEWFSGLPADIAAFMSANRNAKTALLSKDLGITSRPSHTKHARATSAPVVVEAADAAGEAQRVISSEKMTSGADPLKLMGATAIALVGAIGTAALLL